jgi:Fe-S-cluster containining protein
MNRPPSSDSEQTALLAELSALYAEVDAVQADAVCPASTECCRFGVTGREPYVTSIELAALERATARRGGPLSERRRALPLAGSGATERTCALLDRDGRCSVYESRPFGCRTYFCERASGSRLSRDELRDFVRRLAELAARHAPDGDRTRPLTRAQRP